MFDYKNINTDEISERIRKLMEDKGISCKEVADALMVSVQAVSKWMYGKALPDIEHLYNLTGLFGVSIDYLISGLKIRNNRQVLEAAEETYRDLPWTCDLVSGDYYIELSVKNTSRPVDSNVLRLMYYTMGIDKIKSKKYGN